jgi:hypothetical protein
MPSTRFSGLNPLHEQDHLEKVSILLGPELPPRTRRHYEFMSCSSEPTRNIETSRRHGFAAVGTQCDLSATRYGGVLAVGSGPEVVPFSTGFPRSHGCHGAGRRLEERWSFGGPAVGDLKIEAIKERSVTEEKPVGTAEPLQEVLARDTN